MGDVTVSIPMRNVRWCPYPSSVATVRSCAPRALDIRPCTYRSGDDDDDIFQTAEPRPCLEPVGVLLQWHRTRTGMGTENIRFRAKGAGIRRDAGAGHCGNVHTGHGKGAELPADIALYCGAKQNPSWVVKWGCHARLFGQNDMGRLHKLDGWNSSHKPRRSLNICHNGGLYNHH